jgi:CelD/BcsL family acetyltransferase involved in cellulose biosynthesis
VKLTPPVELVSPPDPAAWDALVAASDAATVFHTSAWARLWIAEWPGARWEAVVLPEEHGYAGALGLIIHDGPLGRRVLAMPYGTYSGPIVRRDHPDPSAVRRLLLEGYAQLVRHVWVMLSELTWYEGRRDELPADLVASEAFTHVRHLAADADALMGALPLSVRSRIKQAEPLGLARYDLVEQRGIPIGGSLHFTFRGSAINWLTVSDERKWDLRPNHFLIARVMRDLCAAGFREYNLGGSPPEAEGLIKFKEAWGAERRSVLEVRRRGMVYRMLRGEPPRGPEPV